MPITKSQLLVLTNPQVRQRLPAKRADFAYVDQLLRDVGETCPRLPAVWERILYGLDASTAKWLNASFPGFTFNSDSAVKPLPPPTPPRNAVTRAIDVLQSYKKST